MHIFPGFFSSYPFGFPSTSRNFPIHRHCIFQGNIRHFSRNIMKENLIQSITFFTQKIFFNFNAIFPQISVSFTMHKRIRVLAAYDYTRNSSLHQRMRTRGLFSKMAAWFQSNVNFRTRRIISPLVTIFKRIPLSVLFPITMMKSFANNNSITHNHSPNQWIWICPSFAKSSKFNCTTHIFYLFHFFSIFRAQIPFANGLFRAYPHGRCLPLRSSHTLRVPAYPGAIILPYNYFT